MSDASPDSLKVNPNAKSISRLPLYLSLLAGTIMLSVLYYSINFAHVEETETGSIDVKIGESEQPLWLIEGSGLALDNRKEQISGVLGTPPPPPPSPPKVEDTKPLVEPVLIEVTGRSEEEEHIRRMRTQQYVDALLAPILSKRNDSVNNTSSSQANVVNQNQSNDPLLSAISNASTGGENAYNPASDKDKEAFFARSQKSDNAWILNNVRTAGQQYEMKTGTVVPGIMITGINSDLPGTLIAQVSQNVYDSTTGEHLLIPQGSKLLGVYDSRVIYGQSRVLVAWNRIIYPDGSAITLPSMPGADMAGNAGFKDKVNNHYFRTFSSAVMMALITGGTAYAVDSGGGGGDGGGDEDSLQSQMTSALASQLGQTTSRILEKNLNIKPTLEIRAGYQFNIVLTKDIVFEKPYTAWR